MTKIFSLAEKSNLISLVELFHNRVTYKCLATFNFDGSIRKTRKYKALEKFNVSPAANYLLEYSCLVDTGFIWRLATTAFADRGIVRRYESEYTRGDFRKKVFL